MLNGGTLRTGALSYPYFFNKLVTDTTGCTIDAAGTSSITSLAFFGAGANITINGNSSWNGQFCAIENSSAAELPITIVPGATVTSQMSLESVNFSPSSPILVTGGGTLYLTNQPFYYAHVRVNQARLSMDNLAGVSPTNFDLSLDNGILQYGGPTASATGFKLGPGGGTLEILGTGTTLTLTGAIPGTFAGLTKAGPGTLVLTNAGSTFNGLAVNAGVVQTADDAALGSGPVTVNGGTLRYTASTASARTFYLNSGSIEAASGATVTFNGATVNGGFLRGTGIFALTGNTVISGATAFNSATLNQAGPATLNNFTNGGTFSLDAGLATPTTMSGFTNQGSGSVAVGAGSQINASDFQSYGLLTLNAGPSAASPTRLTNTGGSPLYFNGGSRTFIGSAASPNPQTAIVTSDLELNGALLVNNGTIDGTTNVNYGSLAKGAGMYGVVNVSQGGIYAPGNSPGISTAAAVSFDSTPVSSGAPLLQIELGGTTLGTQYDRLHVTGPLSLGGTLQVLLVNTATFTPAAGDSFDILDWGSLTGTFSHLNLPALSAPLGWDTSQLYIDGKLIVTPFVPGDFNRDGQVTSADIPAMLSALTDLNAYKTQYGLSDPNLIAIGDLNNSGTLTNADLQPLLDLIANNSGSGSVAAVPEPTAIVLCLLAAPILTVGSKTRQR